MISDPMGTITSMVEGLVDQAMDAATAALSGVQDVINQITVPFKMVLDRSDRFSVWLRQQLLLLKVLTL